MELIKCRGCGMRVRAGTTTCNTCGETFERQSDKTLAYLAKEVKKAYGFEITPQRYPQYATLAMAATARHKGDVDRHNNRSREGWERRAAKKEQKRARKLGYASAEQRAWYDESFRIARENAEAAAEEQGRARGSRPDPRRFL